MATLGTLIVKLAADVGGFSAEMEKAALKSQQAAEKVGKAWKRTGDQLAGIGRGMTMGLTLPIVAGAALAVSAASDEAESWNKVSVVFGDNEAAIQTWAANSATSMGISRGAAYEAVGTFGNLFTTMGIGDSASADMSMGLVQMASDMASFNNMDPTEVLDKLRSGLVGETEPLRALGINLSQAAVEAKAMEMGLADADGVISPAALAQARYALIVEQSANSQGDFARTADGMANQMRIAKAKITDMASSIGQKLLPYALKLLTWVQDVIAWFEALDPGIQNTILVVLGLVAVIGPLLIVIGSVVSAIGTLIPIVTAVAGVLSFPLIAIIAAVIAVIALLYFAWTNNWGGIQEKFAVFWAWLQPILMQLWTWLQTTLVAAITTLANFWKNTLLPAITAVWGFVQNSLWPLFTTLVAFMGAAFGLAIRVLAGIWEHTLVPALRPVWDWLSKVFKIIKDDLQPRLKTFGEFIAGTVSGQLENFRGILEGVRKSFQWIQGAIAGVIGKIKEMIEWMQNVPIFDFGGGGGGGGSAPPATPMAAGGNFLVRRPTLFLAGEAGPELASFSGANNIGNGAWNDIFGNGTGNTYVTVNATVANDIDLETMAYRVASVIARRSA